MTTGELADRVRAGDRRALARAITLMESTRADHQEEARAILADVLPSTGGAIRLGISGPPGAGKSTIIETFGLFLISQGHKVAVLAIDPSSARFGGSILGDKTRMNELAKAPEAFIRPSPSGGELGGVARRTREAMLLCEAAGFDVIIIETVGVGQSETAVAEMVDLFLLLVPPGGGDDLQGIKRGIMELADIVLVNKADGDLRPAAGRTAGDYRNALHLMRAKASGITAKVVLCSGLEGVGIDEVWDAVTEDMAILRDTGYLDTLRGLQAVQWMWSEVHDTLADRVRAAASPILPTLEAEVTNGRTTPAEAARRILATLDGGT